MRKMATLATAAAMALALTACGGAASAGGSAVDATSGGATANSAVEATSGGAAADSTAQASESTKEETGASTEGSDTQAADATSTDKPVDKGPNAGSANLLDYGWVAFEMPEGFSMRNADDAWVAIEKKDSEDVSITFGHTPMGTYESAKAMAETLVGESTAVKLAAEPIEAGGHSWYAVINQEEAGGVALFTDISDQNILSVTAVGLSEKDAAVQTVLETVIVDESLLS